MKREEKEDRETNSERERLKVHLETWPRLEPGTLPAIDVITKKL